MHEQVSHAVQEPEGRVAIDKPLRPSMAQIAVPLRLGEMGETHFVVGRHWFSRFERLDKPLTAGKLREAMDRPRRMGLPAAAANLVILVYADQAMGTSIGKATEVVDALERTHWRKGSSRRCSPTPTTCSGPWEPRISQDGARFCGHPSNSVSPISRKSC